MHLEVDRMEAEVGSIDLVAVDRVADELSLMVTDP